MFKNISPQIPSLVLSLFHPLILIFYFLVILLFGSSIGENDAILFNFKLSVIAHVALMTILLPIMLIIGLRVLLKRFKESLLKNQLTFYLLIVAISYIFAMLATSSYLGVMIAQKIFLTTSLSIAVISVLVMLAPISIHLYSLAMLTALIVGAQIMGYGYLEGYVAFFVIVAGLTATVQLYLQKFSLVEIVYSYFLGITMMGSLLLI